MPAGRPLAPGSETPLWLSQRLVACAREPPRYDSAEGCAALPGAAASAGSGAPR